VSTAAPARAPVAAAGCSAGGQPAARPPRVGVFGASGEPGRASDEAEAGSGSGGASCTEEDSGMAQPDNDGGACSTAAAGVEARGEEEAAASRSTPAMRGLRRSSPVTDFRIVRPESSRAPSN
jgi:hypothetical protein